MSQKWYHTSWQRAAIETAFINLKAHIEKVEVLLKQDSAKLTHRVPKEAEHLDQEQRSNLYDHYYDDFFQSERIFPLLHRNSMLVAMMSLFEHSLNAICNELAPTAKCELSLNDLRDKGIDRSKVYLTKVLQVSFPSDSAYWANIKKYRDIRNLIVHNDDRIDLDNVNHRRLVEYVQKAECIHIDDVGTLIIEDGFLLRAANDMVQFLKLLFNSLPEFS